ncbi:MAG: outer membrane beta-barrel protein [Kofleriaceae bacterium]|nr:outer membrane beta-barrel protein [Kofleriaceae bacterium]
MRVAHAVLLLVVATGIARGESEGERESEPTTNITVSGYFETYYQLNFRFPSNRITNLRGFDNRDLTFTIENAALDVKGERGPLAARVILQIGATPSTYYLAEPVWPGTASVNASGPELWKYLQQATFGYTTNGKIVIEAGLFPSPIGPEVFAIKDNWNWSRSDLFFGLPFYHTGTRVSVPLGGGWVGTLHAYNGWNSVVDNNDYPSVAASAFYTGDKLQGQLLYFGGVERPTGSPEGQPWRNLFDAYATLAVTDELSVLGHVDGGFERNNVGTSAWLAGALYAKYALTPALYLAARGDFFREWVPSEGATTAGALFWPSDWIASGTGTVAWQPAHGLSVRLEYRHDAAQDDSFFGGDVVGDGVLVPYVFNRTAQDTLTLGATGWF